jgi:hypothetical protein
MAFDNSCLYTTVRNTSGSARAFGFLGDHGMRLAADEQVTVRGNLVDQVSGHRRSFTALERALEDQALAILKTPGVHLYDDTNDEVKILSLDAGALGSVDPCWGSLSISA